MRLGVQFGGSVPAGSTRRWFTHSWPQAWRTVWMVVPTGPTQDRSAQVEWKVAVERQTTSLLKYFIEIRNISSRTVDIEARYAILD